MTRRARPPFVNQPKRRTWISRAIDTARAILALAFLGLALYLGLKR